MTERDKDDAALEALFDAGRTRAPVPSDDLMARLAADAERALPRPAIQPAPRRSVFARFAPFFAASGLSGAAALGIWVGFAMPEVLNLDSLAPFATGETIELYTFLPGADLTALSE